MSEKWRLIIKPSECSHRRIMEHGRMSIKCLKLGNISGYCNYRSCPLDTTLLTNEELNR